MEDEYNYYNELLKQDKLIKEMKLRESINNGNNYYKTKNSSFLASIEQKRNKNTQLKSNNSTSIQKIVKPNNIGHLYINNCKKNVDSQKYEIEMSIIDGRSSIKKGVSNPKSSYSKNKENNYLQGTIKNYIINNKEEDKEKIELKKKKYIGKFENNNYPKTFVKTKRREIKKNHEMEEKERFDNRDDAIKKAEKVYKEKEEKYRYRVIEKSRLISVVNDLNQKNKKLQNENKIMNEKYALVKKDLEEKNQFLVSENQRLEQLIKEYKEKIKENEFKLNLKDNEIISLENKKKKVKHY